MSETNPIPKWPGYSVQQFNNGVWMATARVNDMILATSSFDRDAAVKGLHDDVRREQGVDVGC